MPAVTDSQKITDNWKRACSIYPVYMEISKRFELGLRSCSDLESPEGHDAHSGADALVSAEKWFRQADQKIEVHHIRELLSVAALGEEVLQAILARHLGKEPKNDSDRDKIDFLLVQYLAQCLPATVSAHELSLEQAAEVLKPILGQASQPVPIAGLEACIGDLRQCASLGDFMDHMILERGRALKVAGREKPFDPTALVAFTRFSFLVRLGSIRLVHEDLLSLEEDLKSLEKAGVKSVDCTNADRTSHESLGAIRKLAEKWKHFFPGKYSRNYWFNEVISVEACVKHALEAAAAKKKSAAANGASAHAAPIEDQLTSYVHDIAAAVQSTKESKAATAIKVQGVRLMLTTEEVNAFRQTEAQPEGQSEATSNTVIQHAVAVRALLLGALEKSKDKSSADIDAARELAQAEEEALQKEIAAAKEQNNTETMVILTACARALQKALDKAKPAQPTA
jgi:hypothetical protein